MGEPLCEKEIQEFRHNIITSVLRIKWLALKSKMNEEDYEDICKNCHIICEEVNKIK
jgi:hypothetical protein